MSNFKQDILKAVDNEPIEGVVFGPFGWDGYGIDRVGDTPRPPQGTVLTWEEAQPFCDFEYDTGYGAPECYAIYVWTSSRVLWVTQYDGSTYFDSAPRHPIDIIPSMPGG